jgi:NTE family protein
MAQPTIALALGAGGARGIAHIHVLEACDEMGITPIAISGASFGAIIGAGYASGLSGRQIKEYILERFQNRASLLADLWKLRPESMNNL